MAVFNLGVILVRWNHAPRDPVARPRSWYQGYYCDASKPGIAHYWFEQTHGRLPFVGQAFDWFDLGASLSDIQLPNNKTIDRSLSRVAALAMLQAAERKMPLAGRDGVVVVTDIVLPPGFVMDSGFAAVDVRSGGVPLPSNVAVLPSGSEFHYAAHEVGHVLGLDHSFGFPQIISNGVPGEYGHFWCIMSAKTYGHAIPVVDTGTDIAEPELRKKGPGLNSGTRVGRGWANPNIVELSPGTNQTLALRSLGSLGEGANVIYVKTSSGETFSIELRTPADNYDKGVLCPMVVINAVKKSLADETYPGYHCASYLGEIQWVDRSIFRGPGFEVEMTYLSPDSRHCLVRLAANPASTYIPAFFPKDRVPIYALKSDGTLDCFFHNGRDNARSDWLGPRGLGKLDPSMHIFPAAGGDIFTVQPDGRMVLRRHDGRAEGLNLWSGPKTVGTGWEKFSRVFAGPPGVVYAMEPNGDLWWYRYIKYRSGAIVWSDPQQVGNGWNEPVTFFPGTQNVIYVIWPDGKLSWYRHDGFETGSKAWTIKPVGSGWGQFRYVFAGARGVIYAVGKTGDLTWYRHDGRHEGTFAWIGPRKVGTGWGKPAAIFEGRN